jgi:3-oxoacyl-[acyl-carrier protein] reductase
MDKNRVLITGGSRGIGQGLCDAFLSSGYEVLATCRDSSKISSKDKNLIYESLDISNPSSIAQFKSVVDDFKPCVLVNNAGITKDNLFLRMSDEQWTDVLNTNLTGTFRVTKLVAKLMLKAKWGRIINISSISGIMGNPGQTNYSASKAGMDGFTRSLAKELGARNITVNSISPGFIETDMTKGLIDEGLIKKIPLGRAGQVSEIASVALFLASEKANYITGQTLVVDGGLFMK